MINDLHTYDDWKQAPFGDPLVATTENSLRIEKIEAEIKGMREEIAVLTEGRYRKPKVENRHGEWGILWWIFVALPVAVLIAVLLLK